MSEPRPSEDERCPLSNFASQLEKAVDRLDNPVRFRAKNAFLHLHKAWRLRHLDQGMAAFRTITAEEEAATALIVSLKRKKYANSERLNPWNHDHKASIFFLMQVISGVLAKTGYTPQVYLVDVDSSPRFRIEIDIHKLAGVESTEPFFAESVLPLDFTVSDEGGVKNFATEFAELASERGHNRVRDYLKAEANLRNQILYASDSGIPRIEIPDEFIFHRRDRVVAILSIVIMLEQTHEIQSFALQSLNALLQILGRLEADNLPLVEPQPTENVRLKIDRTLHASRISVIKDGKENSAQFEYRATTEFKMAWLNTWVI